MGWSAHLKSSGVNLDSVKIDPAREKSRPAPIGVIGKLVGGF